MQGQRLKKRAWLKQARGSRRAGKGPPPHRLQVAPEFGRSDQPPAEGTADCQGSPHCQMLECFLASFINLTLDRWVAHKMNFGTCPAQTDCETITKYFVVMTNSQAMDRFQRQAFKAI
jgi:hypothetical protein